MNRERIAIAGCFLKGLINGEGKPIRGETKVYIIAFLLRSGLIFSVRSCGAANIDQV